MVDTKKSRDLSPGILHLCYFKLTHLLLPHDLQRPGPAIGTDSQEVVS
jgi:hypothetical protein